MLTLPPGIDPSKTFSPFDLASRKAVIAAVSGGSDSTALLVLLKDHLERFCPTSRLVAVTVDHRLRAESAKEAAGVGRLCAKLGVSHRILEWTGVKPATGLAASAREARHELLAEAARVENTDVVLTGHTANDQAETVLMRHARDVGRGLAGIAPATLFDGGIWFARPLLQARRESLRHFLRERQMGWIDDPTNVNERYERPRLRKTMGVSGGEHALAGALAVAADAARRREALGRQAAILLRDLVDRPTSGLLRLQPHFFQAAERDAAVYALRILLAVAGGASYLPDETRAAALHDRLAVGAAFRGTLSRVLVDQRKAGIFLLREARGLPSTVEKEACWDGRYRIVARPPEDGDRLRQVEQIDLRTVPESLVAAAAAGEPKMTADFRAIPVMAPWARYLPSFDLAPAHAVARLLGAREIPRPPFGEHIESNA